MDSARKSGRANKGKNSRLDRADEVVEMPQAKAKEASLNPSWLKNHDGKKETPTKRVPGTPVKAASTPVVASKSRVKSAKEEEEETAATTEEEETMEEDEEEVPAVSDKSSIPLDLTEDELKKLAGKTLMKGEDEYVIVVQGVNDTGLCGKYWGDLDNLPSRRRSKQPDQLQAGASQGRDTPTSRRGSIGSVGSGESPASVKKPEAKIPKPKPELKITPKSSKKQVTKPERRAVEADSSQSEGEDREEPEAAKSRYTVIIQSSGY